MEIHCVHELYGHNIVKTSVLHKLIYGVNESPIKIQAVFIDINKLIIKFIWKGTALG